MTDQEPNGEGTPEAQAAEAGRQTVSDGIVIECLTREGHVVDVRPAPQNRDWMDATPQQFAYRCLPLNIANAHNWEIHTPAGFRAMWKGGPMINDIVIEHDDPDGPVAAMSHFGSGVLTFPITGLMRTQPGYDLWVMGPVNRPKADIQALSAVIETDWLAFTFTMNWLFTRPDEWVRFEKGEPFCAFFPVPRGMLEHCDPVFRRFADEPELEERFKAYANSRLKFNEDLKVPGSEARAAKWQKTYFQGTDEALAVPHRTKLRARPFRPRD